MNRKLSLVALAALAIYPLVPGITRSRPLLGFNGENSTGERDEIKQSYELAPGARVSVLSISGPVEIETSSGSRKPTLCNSLRPMSCMDWAELKSIRSVSAVVAA